MNGYGSTGSIPASAGEPIITRDVAIPYAVYPRECGGTGSAMPSPVTGRGLSPRVRGNLRIDISEDTAAGSIPASAGGTSTGKGTIVRL